MSPAELRRACGIRQADVAAAFGVSRVTVSRWEKGRAFPRHDRREGWMRVQRGFARHLAVTW